MENLMGKLVNTRDMVLATSYNEHVTARSVSTIVVDNKIYFQVNKKSEKYHQLANNNKVAMTKGFLQLEGIAKDIKSWKSNQELCEVYKSKHLSSYNAYGELDGQTVIEVSPTRLKLWSYEDNDAFIYIWEGNEVIKVKQDKSN